MQNRTKTYPKKIVFVGLSGGVDSAVSAALLKQEGYEVVGVFIKTWHPEFLQCNEEDERKDAMRVAAHLDIPFLTLNLEDVYKREVADYMIAEYKKGRTPNPDVMCNKEVKFGAFLKWALSNGADYVATGHYAKNAFFQSLGAGPRPTSPFKKYFLLRKGKDPSKDQSYFLWTLTQSQLSKILFPIGHLNKSEVRKLAKKFNLPVAEKKDSQGICFLGAVDLKDFLKHYIAKKRGKVINKETGKEIGFHEGVFFHTLGERHGFTITKKSPADKPYYIIGKDTRKNILIVSQNKENHYSSIITDTQIENTNWTGEMPNELDIYTAQIRYHGELLECKVKITSNNQADIIFLKKISVASGQSCVIYDKDVCLGGGVVV